MIRAFLKNQLVKHKALFFQEAQRISGFLYLLMKQRNTGEKWTPEEKKEIKKRLSGKSPDNADALLVCYFEGISYSPTVLSKQEDFW